MPMWISASKKMELEVLLSVPLAQYNLNPYTLCMKETQEDFEKSREDRRARDLGVGAMT